MGALAADSRAHADQDDTVLVALWHDRTARTRQLRTAIAAVVVLGVACLGLAMLTGDSDNAKSDPIPFKVSM